MTNVDPFSSEFLGVPVGRAVSPTLNKERAEQVDPFSAEFLGVSSTDPAPRREAADFSVEMPYTPPTMAGALARGFVEGLASGPIPTFAKNAVQSFVSGVATAPGDITYGNAAMMDEMQADREAKDARRILGFTEYKLSGSAPKDAKSIAELDKRLPNWRDYQKAKYLPPEEVKALRDAGFRLDEQRRLGSLEYKLEQNKIKPGTFSDEEIVKDREAARVLQENSKKRLSTAENERDWQAQSREIFTPEAAKVDQGDTSKAARYGRVAGSGASSLAVAAAAGPTAGSLVLASMEAQGAYDNAVREGMSPDDARARVGQTFIWSAMSEWPQLEFMKDGRGFVKGAISGAASEIPQEEIQQIGLNIINKRPWDEGLVDSAVGALFSGGIVGGVTGKINSMQYARAATPKPVHIDADAWIKENTDMLPEIAAKEKLSRHDWYELGLPRVPEAERAAFLQKVKDTVGGVATVVEDAPAVQEQDTPEPEAAVTEEAKPAKAPVPEAKAAVDEVQAELDAQTEEEDAEEAGYALFGKREPKTPTPDATATPVEPETTAPTETAAEAVKPVETSAAAEEQRKKGKRVPKAKKPTNKGKGVVEPVVETAKTEDAQEKEYMSEVIGDMPGVDAKRISLKWSDGTGGVNFVDVYHDGKYAGRAVVGKRGEKTGFQDAANRSVASVKAMLDSTAMGVREDVKAKRTVSSEVIDAVGEVPEGYIREGERYVFKPTAHTPPVADVAAKEMWQMTKDEKKSSGLIYGSDKDSLLAEIEKKEPRPLKKSQMGNLAALSAYDNAKREWNKVYHPAVQSQHQRMVEKAIAEGKPVPAEVLADFPEIAKAAEVDPLKAKGRAKPVKSTDLDSGVPSSENKAGTERLRLEQERAKRESEQKTRQEELSVAMANAKTQSEKDSIQQNFLDGKPLSPTAPAPVKVETEKNGNKTISVPKADKPSTTPAMQRAYLEAEIDKAMESAPAESDAIKDTRKIAENEYGSSSARENARRILRQEPKVTIEVPNDGTYSIFNTKEALSEFKKRVPKMFPDKAPKANMKPSLGVNTGRISAEQISMSNPDVIAQYKIQLENGIYSDADTKTIREGVARAERSAAIKKEKTDKIAAEVAKAKAEGVEIELVDAVSDLPAEVRAMLPTDTSNIKGFYVNGKTYIIGENVTADRAEAVVREEMAHRKLDTAKGEELIDEFKKRMTEKDRKALIKEGYTKARGESDADYEARLADEFIAKQARKNTSVWTEFVDSVKSFLESVGIRDLTSEEAARVILRKLRSGAATGNGVRYSLREQDAAYLAAVNSGDEATAQKMVDEAAKRAGYTVGPVWHGGPSGITTFTPSNADPTIGRGVSFSPTLADAEIYSRMQGRKTNGKVYRAFIRLNNPTETQIGKDDYDSAVAKAESIEHDGMIVRDVNGNVSEYSVRNPSQIKSADAVTRDDSGRVIPLSERFNADSNDIRYSLIPAAELDEAKYESAKGIFGPKLERVGEAEFRKWVAEKFPDSAMPYAERFLSERSAMATIPNGRTTSLARRVSEPERAALGLDTETRGGQGTWAESVARAASTVKSNESAGDELISELVDNPRPLTQDEIALLLRAKTQRWNARDAAMKTRNRAKIDTAQKRLLEAYYVSDLGPDKSISMMGAALNALKMMNNEKYELINMTQEMYAITGDISKPGSQAYKDLEAIAQQYKERTEVLERENTRLQEEAEKMNQSLADALRQAGYNQGKPKNKGKSKASKIATVADLISKKSREYADELEREYNDSMKKLNSQMASGVNPERVLALSKLGAAYILRGTANVADAIAKAAGVAISKAEMAQIMAEAKKIATDATSRIAKEAESETLASRVIPKGKGAKTATQLSEVSLKDMFREQAENGVKTFKEALPLVGKLVRDSGIDATDAQIRDVYDSYIKEPGVLSTDEIKKIIAAYRQEAQLLSKINDAERGVRPHKIGAPRFPSSQEARTYQKELDDIMKTTTFSDGKKGTDIASPLDAKKTWMLNEIADMEKAIALHEKRFQGEKGITDQGDIEYQRLKAQLEDVRKRYAEAFPKTPLTPEESLEILIKQEEKILARWNQRVIDAQSGKFTSKERVERPYSERLAELKAKREDAKAEVARLYELQNPGKRAREAQMKRDLAAIKEMKRRMAAGDYMTPTTTTMDLSGDAPAMAAHLAREQTKKRWEQHKARAAWNKLKPGRKLLIVAKNILMSDKAFKYSADDSNPGRQGWMFALTHTEKWFKTAKRGLSAASSKNSAQIIQEIKENELYKSGVLKASGLNINVKDATGQYGSEDDANLEFVNKIPVYGEVTKVSGRMFGATANLQRLEFFTTILEGSKFGREILADPYHRTDAQNEFLKHVGWGVNIFTGFAGNNIIKPGFLLGAPNWVFSVLLNFGQVPVFNALFDGDWKAAAALEKQYGRFYLATISLIAAMSLLPSGPKDDEGKRKRHRVVLDPRSNRVGIGYIPYTAIPINVYGPLAPWIHFIGINVTGQKISGGEIINLRNSFLWTHTEEQKAKGVPWKGGQMYEDLKFLRSKFRPLVTTAMGLRDGLNFLGQETSRLRLLFEAYQPLTPLNFIENLVRVPPEQAAAETLMEFFGFDSKPDFNTPQYKKYEAKMAVVDEMFRLKFKGENGKSFGDRAEDIYIANAMKTIHAATDTDSSPGSQESAKMMIDDLGLDACLMLLYYQAINESLSRGSTKLPEENTKDGNLSAYGKRVQKLRIISAQ